jgi:hypothetical protein
MANSSHAAKLSFDKTTIAVTLDPEADRTTIRFPFSNTSDQTIEIADHSASCSCLIASFEGGKTVYAPGDKGTVIAIFERGNMVGTVSKNVMIWKKGDAEDAPSISLTVDITIPEIVSITPRTLKWKTGGAAEPKTYAITISGESPLQITRVTSTNSIFSCELKTVRDGWEYELIVTPEDTGASALGIFNLTTDSRIPRFTRITAFAAIRQTKDD